ncbi:hypothetical protein L0U85_15320 [Glycomyces sp. L485]|uniref:hypothetical protein n=1 Tax=Glycomyces sp. L485 TaxID=2909235 RepID=UPI001F4A2552|nr:hypothetical protein [Glycomyces sp. L485]MCH7232215.1 hypothetical protein [Glycomyces sp. L485]
MAERGRGEWRFAEDGRLHTASYGLRFYLDGRSGIDESFESEGETEIPEAPALPDDIPADFDDKRAYEADIAVDFAECGDETGYRQTATEAWEAAHAEQYAAIEAETYAWQEEMRADIERAQDLIDS